MMFGRFSEVSVNANPMKRNTRRHDMTKMNPMKERSHRRCMKIIDTMRTFTVATERATMRFIEGMFMMLKSSSATQTVTAVRNRSDRQVPMSIFRGTM